MNKKELLEKIADCQDKMNAIVEAAKAENRPLTEEEANRFSAAETEAKNAQATIDAMEKVSNMQTPTIIVPEKVDPEQQAVKDFCQMVRSGQIKQADTTKGDNAAVIPKTIVNKVIDRVKDISPIFRMAERYNVKGKLSIPYVDAANDNIAMSFATEFTALTATASKLLTVDLEGILAGVLVTLSKSLANNSDIDIEGFIVNKMANAYAAFVEKEILTPSDPTNKIVGLSNLAAAQKKTTASATAITADELIEAQDKLKGAFQGGAAWIMNPTTLTALRQLKYATTGEYILTPDYRAGFGTLLLGKPVYVSDAMDGIATGKTVIYYGDFGQGLALQVSENFEVQTLNELYATQHAIGFVGFTEFDAKIQNQQAIASVVMA